MINKISSALLLGLTTLPLFGQKETRPNILFIAIDDFKPIIGCYGDSLVKTPNIDRLAKSGSIFLSNYCQQAVSGPTRASIMTGMRPDYTGVWDLKTRMRDVNPNIVSLPQYLISQGYTTQGIGKVYDQRCVDNQMDEPSWSVPYYNYAKADKNFIAAGYDEPLNGHYQLASTLKEGERLRQEAIAKGMSKSEIADFLTLKIKPTTECADVPDNAYNDGANVRKAATILSRLKEDNKPFFFAVGISKPHLPFVAPKKYWDLYQRDKMPVAQFQGMVKDGIEIAYHDAGEIRSYTDILDLLSFTDQKPYGITLPLEKQKELIHGYHAAVSYTDANVGVLLNALDSLGLSKNTIVILWGDHGWHLGDHNLWCKHSDFEQATRTPMIIYSPGIVPRRINSMSEFVDIFPTICDLAGVPIPAHLDGKSLKPLMKNEPAKVKEYAVSQYPRSMQKEEATRLGLKNGKCMGYSLRTKNYRYTIWLANGFNSSIQFDPNAVVGEELYDYTKDPLETVNLIKDKSYSSVQKELKGFMLDYFKEQRIKLAKR